MCLIRLPEEHDIRDIVKHSLELSIPSCSDSGCKTGKAIFGFPLRRCYLAFFPRQDLIEQIENRSVETPTKLDLKVSGDLEDGTRFEGVDSIWVIRRGRRGR